MQPRRRGSLADRFQLRPPRSRNLDRPAVRAIDHNVDEFALRRRPTFALPEDAVKAIQVPVEVVVGDQDPIRRLYVAPLQKIRPDWPAHIISGAGHLLCIFKPDFKAQVVAALAKPQRAPK